MFTHVQPAPPDAILGLTEAFKADPNPDKINLSVGVYQDETGKTPLLTSVRMAEQRMVQNESGKSYLPISGHAGFGKAVRQLMFGIDSELVEAGRAVTCQTPGGTGALRVCADYLKQNHPDATVWAPDPTWANHPNIFGAAGIELAKYPYANDDMTALDFQALIQAVEKMNAGDVILLHGCCHNPTGIDLDLDQWQTLAATLAHKQVTPVVDLAYQGFGTGLAEDVQGLSALTQGVSELIICSSYSKNFSLYNERVGALTLVAQEPAPAQAVFSQIKKCIRANYSNPPAHGATIVATILDDAQLVEQWHQDLRLMRHRINEMRRQLAQQLADMQLPGDFSFIARQRGMFSMLPITRQHVQKLKEDHAIYIVGSGRINVAGLTEANLPRFTEALGQVIMA